MDLLLFPPRTLTVLNSPEAAGGPVVELIAHLALHNPVTILDGGNCFPAYRLLRRLRGRTGDPQPAMQRVFVRRAFTCHQVLAMLEGTPSQPQPHIVLDFLTTFYDEQVPENETRRLFNACLRQLERLALSAPLLVTVTPPRLPARSYLLEQVSARAGRLHLPGIPSRPALQPSLF